VAKSKVEIKGMKELEAAFKGLTKVPNRAVTSGARKVGKLVLASAKAKAPEDSGLLKESLTLARKKERSKAGKAMYQVYPSEDPYYTDQFAKMSKAGKRSYYPASMEYGFMHATAGFIPGYHYMKRSIDDNKEQIEHIMTETVGKGIEKAWQKG
jgi:HK97 gp10 family phage protein